MWLMGFKEMDARYDSCVSAAATYFDALLKVLDHYHLCDSVFTLPDFYTVADVQSIILYICSLG